MAQYLTIGLNINGDSHPEVHGELVIQGNFDLSWGIMYSMGPEGLVHWNEGPRLQALAAYNTANGTNYPTQDGTYLLTFSHQGPEIENQRFTVKFTDGSSTYINRVLDGSFTTNGPKLTNDPHDRSS